MLQSYLGKLRNEIKKVQDLAAAASLDSTDAPPEPAVSQPMVTDEGAETPRGGRLLAESHKNAVSISTRILG